jgi:hypothetical protein
VVFFVFLLDFGNVPTMWYLLFFYWIWKWKNKKYHIVGTFPKSNRKIKNTTLSEHFQNPIEKQKIPHCLNISKIQ